MAQKGGRYEIKIRKLSLSDARHKLEQELNSAFLQGKTRIHIVHGIGEGKLKALTATIVTELGLGAIVNDAIDYNPGVTIVDLNPPDAQSLRQYIKR